MQDIEANQGNPGSKILGKTAQNQENRIISAIRKIPKPSKSCIRESRSIKIQYFGSSKASDRSISRKSCHIGLSASTYPGKQGNRIVSALRQAISRNQQAKSSQNHQNPCKIMKILSKSTQIQGNPRKSKEIGSLSQPISRNPVISGVISGISAVPYPYPGLGKLSNPLKSRKTNSFGLLFRHQRFISSS